MAEPRPWQIQYEEESFDDEGVSSGWRPKFHTIWSDTEPHALEQFQIDVPPVEGSNRRVSKVFLNQDWVRQYGACRPSKPIPVPGNESNAKLYAFRAT